MPRSASVSQWLSAASGRATAKLLLLGPGQPLRRTCTPGHACAASSRIAPHTRMCIQSRRGRQPGGALAPLVSQVMRPAPGLIASMVHTMRSRPCGSAAGTRRSALGANTSRLVSWPRKRRSTPGSLRRLVLEGHPAAVLGELGVDLRFLGQLTSLEVFAPKALRLVPAKLPQGLIRMVCTMDAMRPGAGRITWATGKASAPPGCLPRLDCMHIRVSGAVRLDAAHAWPGVHVHLSACPGPSRGDFAVARAHVGDSLWHGAQRGIFHTARSVFVSGCDMSFSGHPRSLPQLLCPTTGPLTEVVLDARACFRARDDGDDDDGDDNGGGDGDDEDADDVLQGNIRALALNLHMLIEARGDVYAFELTGIATERPVLAWRRWPCAGTREHDAARAAHARTRAWAWRELGLDVMQGLPGILV